MRNHLVLSIVGVLLIVSLTVPGVVFVCGSKESGSIVDGGHKGVKLWKDGPYWSETNIGAENPWDYGYYFWWGNPMGLRPSGTTFIFSFKPANCPTSEKSTVQLQIEGWVVSKAGTYVLSPTHDAAHVYWGGEWRIPTKQELSDLESKCDWTWTTINGVCGYVVKGRGYYSSFSIFLPCAGHVFMDKLLEADSGYYWSSVPDSNNSNAWCLNFNLSYHDTHCCGRYSGMPVRPVQGGSDSE